MVQRLAKGVLPPNTQIHKDAMLAMQKGATVFINHLASQYVSLCGTLFLRILPLRSLHRQRGQSFTNARKRADSLAQSTNRRTIPPQAISDALRDLEFEHFVPRVEAELKKYNEMQTGKRNEYRRKIKEEKQGGARAGMVEGSSRLEGDGREGDEAEDEEEGRAVKRLRRGSQEESDASVNGTAARVDLSPSAQLGRTRAARPGHGGDVEELEMLDPPEEEEGDDGGNDDQGEDDDVGEEDEEAGEEEDDEDEYPDEGRRLSSLEPDPDEDQERGREGSGGDESDGSQSGEGESD